MRIKAVATVVSAAAVAAAVATVVVVAVESPHLNNCYTKLAECKLS